MENDALLSDEEGGGSERIGKFQRAEETSPSSSSASSSTASTFVGESRRPVLRRGPGGGAKRRVAAAAVAAAAAVVCVCFSLKGSGLTSAYGGESGGGNGAAQSAVGGEVVSLAGAGSVDPEPFTCARFGCLDIKSPTHPCQCSHFCVKNGTCCSDYQAVCADVTPATNPRLGEWGGCEPSPALPAEDSPIWHLKPAGPPLTVKVMSYNPEWWHVIEQLGGNGNGPAKVIAEASEAEPIDFIGFQEFYDPWWGLSRPGFNGSGLLEEYFFVRGEVGGPVGTIIAFRRSVWALLDHGQHFVAEDIKGPNYFGKRIILWARLKHAATGRTALVANHHGPLPINTGGRCGAETTAANLLSVLASKAAPGDLVVLVGDFNADGASRTVTSVAKYLEPTFPGIDHIFHNLPKEAVAEARAWGSGGSDHAAITALLHVPGAPGAEAAEKAEDKAAEEAPKEAAAKK